MELTHINQPMALTDIKIRDTFWENMMELVRTEVIPYQWKALNDRIEGAAPSYCMRNFEVAAKLTRNRREHPEMPEPVQTFRGFETLPEDPRHLEDTFYGFVFQDSDVYKWIEAAAYSLIQHPDMELERIADSAIKLVCAVQQEDGYLNTYYIILGKDKAFSNLRDHHELYCFGHLTEAAVAYKQATGKDRLLLAAERYADCIAEHFGTEEGKCKGYPGHEIAEMALVRLYEETGKQKYLDLSAYFINQRGQRPYYFDIEHPECVPKEDDNTKLRFQYHQAHLPVREQEEAVGHAVRAVYLYSGLADVARLTNDEELYKSCRKIWKNIIEKKMYITGGIGATHIGEAFSFAYDLPNDTAYAETCASIGMAFFARRMLEIEADSQYADILEREIYNGILSGMMLDGKSFFYVNPLEVLPEACYQDERKFHVKPVRQKWFGCACCPPNLARFLSSIGSYAFTEAENTLFIHLYIGATVEKNVGNGQITLQMESGFPYDGHVSMRVMDSVDQPVTIAFRLPDWCPDYEIQGIEDCQTKVHKGYLYLTKIWNTEDRIVLHFPMQPIWMTANPKVREDIGKAAIMRGPLVYCLEEADNGNNLHLIKLNEDMKLKPVDFEIKGTHTTAIKGMGLKQNVETDSLYSPYRPATYGQQELLFIPYYLWANRGEGEMVVWVRC